MVNPEIGRIPEEYFRPPQSWHDALRLYDGQPVGDGAYVTNSFIEIASGFRFSFLSIPGDKSQFKLNPGIYIVTTVTPEDIIEENFTTRNLYVMGTFFWKMIGDFIDDPSPTTAELPESLISQFSLPEETEIDFGNNTEFRLRNETMHGYVIYEIVQRSVSDAVNAFKESMASGSSNSTPPRCNN